MKQRALFVSKNLIGDGLYISPALQQWARENPDHDIYLLTNDDHVASIYPRMGVPLTVVYKADFSFDFCHEFDVSKAFAVCDKKRIHVAEGYAELLGVTIPPFPGKKHLRPTFNILQQDRDMYKITDDQKGLVLVSMFSMSCTSRDKNRPGLPPNKMLPWPKWAKVIDYLRAHFGDRLAFVGAPDDRAPLDIPETDYITGIPLPHLALLMSESKCVITLDNGMAHLANAVGATELVFYPMCLGLHYIVPPGNPRLLVAHVEPSTVETGAVVNAVKSFVKEFKL